MRPGMAAPESSDLTTFGANVRALRGAEGWSQVEFAVRLTERGKSADGAYVSRIESGSINPTVETVCEIARALGVHPGRLFDGIAEG